MNHSDRCSLRDRLTLAARDGGKDTSADVEVGQHGRQRRGSGSSDELTPLTFWRRPLHAMPDAFSSAGLLRQFLHGVREKSGVTPPQRLQLCAVAK